MQRKIGKVELIDKLAELATLDGVKTERLNTTAEKCIEMASICMQVAADYDFVVDNGKSPSLELIREARQWIKQALDADKRTEMEADEAIQRLHQQEAAAQMAAGLGTPVQ